MGRETQGMKPAGICHCGKQEGVTEKGEEPSKALEIENQGNKK